jgi:2-(1,2-epoxy-1,2-dihydrophenyl)acetyl-CoA isomerase
MTEPLEAYETVNLHLNEGAATIELNRPDSLNAWNKQFGHDLLAAVERCASDDAVRAVLVRGAGRGFSSGADLKQFSDRDEITPEGRPDVRKRLTGLYHPILVGLRTMEKPVVAGVKGPAVGIGCSLALACDLILASQSAYFLLAFVNIGLVPDGGSSAFIPSRIGMARHAEMALLGERIPAPQALDWGLINKVFPDDQLDAEADALVAKLAAGPTKSYAGSKRQLNNWIYGRLDEQLEFEAEIQYEMAHTSDFLEGVTAFVEKRGANFAGS